MEYFAQLKDIVSKKNHPETGDVLKAIGKIEKKCKNPDSSILPAFQAKIEQIINKLDTSVLIYKQLIELLDLVSQGNKKAEAKVAEEVIDESKKPGDVDITLTNQEVKPDTSSSIEQQEPADQHISEEPISKNDSSTSSVEFEGEEARQYQLIQKLDIAIQVTFQNKSRPLRWLFFVN